MRQYGLYFIRLSYPLADYSLSQNAFFSKKMAVPSVSAPGNRLPGHKNGQKTKCR
ncbi:hypothetical protein BN439_2984 [Erwinia amylovora Ea644]|nr:hypothetical protein BN439_2984 [Erwinia amylovora Ea644]